MDSTSSLGLFLPFSKENVLGTRVYFGLRQPRFHGDDSDERLREGYLKIVKGELCETLSGQTITVLDSLNVKIKQSFGIKLTPDENWN